MYEIRGRCVEICKYSYMYLYVSEGVCKHGSCHDRALQNGGKEIEEKKTYLYSQFRESSIIGTYVCMYAGWGY